MGFLDDMISAGSYHTCGIKINGSVQCWGTGTTDDGCSYYECGQSSPPNGSFVQISAGFKHTCGIKSDGSVQCWGAGTTDDDCNNFGDMNVVKVLLLMVHLLIFSLNQPHLWN